VSAPAVPFVRQLKLGSTGQDVIAIKRALSRGGWMEWGAFTALYGPHMVNAVKALEKTKGLKQTGVYMFTRHEALRKSRRQGTTNEWAFDALSISILKGEAVSPEERMRQRIVDAAVYGIVKRDVIHYAQIRPMTDMGPPPNVPNTMDCSWFATWCYMSGGAPDPNGRNYSSPILGYTGTMYPRGRAVSVVELKLGDLVFYGWRDGIPTHMGVYIGNGYIASHGQESGPSKVPVLYRQVTGCRSYL